MVLSAHDNIADYYRSPIITKLKYVQDMHVLRLTLRAELHRMEDDDIEFLHKSESQKEPGSDTPVSHF